MAKGFHIAATAGVVVPPLMDIIMGWQAGDLAGGLGNVVQGYTSYNPIDGSQSFVRPAIYYGSAVAGGLASKYIGRMVNKYTPKGINI